MPITLNQVQSKIGTICLGHKQVRSFFYGLKTDLLADKTTLYPAVFLDDNGGNISPGGHAVTTNWRLWFLDLVNVADHTNQNDIESTSDMLSVAIDIITQLGRDSNGWVISKDNTFQQYAEHENDMPWGIAVDFSIRFQYPQNVCEVPSTITGL